MQRFGGPWTEQKLALLQSYLEAYTTALAPRQYFELWYLDAFAGTTYSAADLPEPEPFTPEPGQLILFPDVEADAEASEEELTGANFRHGSTRIALELDRPFDQYVFIDVDEECCRDLENLRDEYPQRAGRIRIECGDANEVLVDLARRVDWRRRRGVLFLDPFSNEVRWSTLVAISATRHIDVWYLFPLNMGPARLLPSDPERILPGHMETLDALFGTHEWFEEIYQPIPEGLFDVGDARVRVPNLTDALTEFIMRRLRALFPAVSAHPRVLRNSKNSPLYLLAFAMSNPSEKAVALGMRIAEHVLAMED